ncbi:MAG TPA: DUF1553 domain-containing protein, partial [Planctomycetota bacterium]|nr:DUF1553 domain-containing protein [Planctomycetota bacterium]
KEKIESRRRSAREEFAAWLATTTPETEIAKVSVEGLHFEASFDEGSGREVNVLVVGSSHKVRLAPTAQWKEGALGSKALDVRGAALEVSDAGDFERDQPFTLSARVLLPGENQAGAICARMDNTQSYRGWDFWVENRRAGSHIISSWPNDALKVVAKAQIPVNRWTHVTVAYDGSGKASGVRIYYDGVAQETQVLADRLQGSIRTAVPLKVGQRHTSEGLRATIQDFRIYTRALAAVEVASLAGTSRANAILAKPVEERTEAEKDSLYTWWLEMVDETHRALRGDLRELEAEEARIRTRGTVAHVMQERSEPAHAYILFRGEYDKRRDRVEADTPDILPPFPDEFPRNRLGFAKWLLLDDHPLTARVTVNRFWQEVFGTGIVRTTGDFGISGELPMHPELLDWLAVDFRENGWDVKRLFKLFVTSATYRQSATVTPEKIEKDPENRLLSRGPRFRMDAEMIRDYALQASGLLVRDIGGPSVKPYQPPGVWEAIAMNVSNTREYVRDAGENLYRRSLYTFWKRMAPPASMEILNAPNREFCVVRRDRTNTPLQALVTLNDEQFIEAARHLAQTAIRQGDTFEERLRIVGLRLVARPFRPEEVEVIRASLDSLLAYYEAHSDDAAEVISVGESAADPGMAPAELAAWTLLSNQLFNLDEVLNK